MPRPKAFLALLASPAPGAQERAASALSNLSANDENVIMFAARGGIPPLVALFASPSAIMRVHGGGRMLQPEQDRRERCEDCSARRYSTYLRASFFTVDPYTERAASALCNLSRRAVQPEQEGRA